MCWVDSVSGVPTRSQCSCSAGPLAYGEGTVAFVERPKLGNRPAEHTRGASAAFHSGEIGTPTREMSSVYGGAVESGASGTCCWPQREWLPQLPDHLPQGSVSLVTIIGCQAADVLTAQVEQSDPYAMHPLEAPRWERVLQCEDRAGQR